MGKYRQAPKVDANQSQIVAELRKAGCTVETNKDDILVGYKGKTLWVEIKAPDTWKKTGGVKAGTFKDSQIGLLKNWKGAYMAAWNSEQILSELGVE